MAISKLKLQIADLSIMYTAQRERAPSVVQMRVRILYHEQSLLHLDWSRNLCLQSRSCTPSADLQSYWGCPPTWHWCLRSNTQHISKTSNYKSTRKTYYLQRETLETHEILLQIQKINYKPKLCSAVFAKQVSVYFAHNLGFDRAYIFYI